MKQNKSYPIITMERSFNDLASVVQARFPELSSEQAGTVTGVLLDQITRQISEGSEIAFVKRNAAGTIDLTILDLELIKGKK